MTILSWPQTFEQTRLSCAHDFKPSTRQGYRVCRLCGSYHSVASLPPEAIYGRDYWTHEKGHSTLQEQVYNVQTHQEGGVSKNRFVLNRIYCDTSAVLDIGCAPGALLRHLKHPFMRVVGIEADPSFEQDIREIGGGGFDLLFGLFPDVTKVLPDESFSCIIGCDVFEHVEDPKAFLRECYRLLKPHGQLFLMAPLIMDEEPPDRFFEPVEHVWIHTGEQVRLMLMEAEFNVPEFDRWCRGHESVSARRLP